MNPPADLSSSDIWITRSETLKRWPRFPPLPETIHQMESASNVRWESLKFEKRLGVTDPPADLPPYARQDYHRLMYWQYYSQSVFVETNQKYQPERFPLPVLREIGCNLWTTTINIWWQICRWWILRQICHPLTFASHAQMVATPFSFNQKRSIKWNLHQTFDGKVWNLRNVWGWQICRLQYPPTDLSPPACFFILKFV